MSSPLPNVNDTPPYPHSTRIILSLGAACIAVGVLVIIYYLFSPDPGLSEFQAAQQALQKVHSWRMKTSVMAYEGRRESREHEVDCPDAQHLTVHFDGRRNGQAIQETMHQYFIRGNSYSVNHLGIVQRTKDDLLNPFPICRDLAAAQDTLFFPPFSKFIRSGAIKPGLVKTVGEEQCREWIIRYPFPDVNESETVCIGLKDHLPRFRETFADRTTYSDYNALISIVPPA